MFIVFSDDQRRHIAKYIIYNGKMHEPFEVPERIDSILDVLLEKKLGKVIQPEVVNEQSLWNTHEIDMIDFLHTSSIAVNEVWEHGVSMIYPTFFPHVTKKKRPTSFEAMKGYYCTDTVTPIDRYTWKSALCSASSAISGASLMIRGEKLVYALCRPPGHHAGSSFFGGYCYLNNTALAVNYLLSKNNEKIAILDIDYHHGNGTQEIFYSNPMV